MFSSSSGPLKENWVFDDSVSQLFLEQPPSNQTFPVCCGYLSHLGLTVSYTPVTNSTSLVHFFSHVLLFLQFLVLLDLSCSLLISLPRWIATSFQLPSSVPCLYVVAWLSSSCVSVSNLLLSRIFACLLFFSAFFTGMSQQVLETSYAFLPKMFLYTIPTIVPCPS